VKKKNEIKKEAAVVEAQCTYISIIGIIILYNNKIIIDDYEEIV
jgi:hypothetical protein